MNLDELNVAASDLTADLRSLACKKLYVCANAYGAVLDYPDRIVVEGIKNLRTTGRFTDSDRRHINAKLIDFCTKFDLNLKIIDSDSAMHNAIITCK